MDGTEAIKNGIVTGYGYKIYVEGQGSGGIATNEKIYDLLFNEVEGEWVGSNTKTSEDYDSSGAYYLAGETVLADGKEWGWNTYYGPGFSGLPPWGYDHFSNDEDEKIGAFGGGIYLILWHQKIRIGQKNTVCIRVLQELDQ